MLKYQEFNLDKILGRWSKALSKDKKNKHLFKVDN
jgi:hypothetical protein